MQRFPHYEDLKDLNNKFLPELSKIELHLYKFEVEIEKCQLIIQTLDESLAKKSSRQEMEILHLKLLEEYPDKILVERFQVQMEAKVANNERKIDNLVQNVKY